MLRYVDNPNGSVDDIAGVCNEGRNVVGLMPHPERACNELLGSPTGRCSCAPSSTPRSPPRADRMHPAVLRYPGSKWTLAEKIVEQFQPHFHYVEPYFGSGAVFFSKPPARHEVINDRNQQVTNLFAMLRDRTDGAVLVAGGHAVVPRRVRHVPPPVRRSRRGRVAASSCGAGRPTRATSPRRRGGRTVARSNAPRACRTGGTRCPSNCVPWRCA